MWDCKLGRSYPLLILQEKYITCIYYPLLRPAWKVWCIDCFFIRWHAVRTFFDFCTYEYDDFSKRSYRIAGIVLVALSLPTVFIITYLIVVIVKNDTFCLTTCLFRLIATAPAMEVRNTSTLQLRYVLHRYSVAYIQTWHITSPFSSWGCGTLLIHALTCSCFQHNPSIESIETNYIVLATKVSHNNYKREQR